VPIQYQVFTQSTSCALTGYTWQAVSTASASLIDEWSMITL